MIDKDILRKNDHVYFYQGDARLGEVTVSHGHRTISGETWTQIWRKGQLFYIPTTPYFRSIIPEERGFTIEVKKEVYDLLGKELKRFTKTGTDTVKVIGLTDAPTNKILVQLSNDPDKCFIYSMEKVVLDTLVINATTE